MKKIHLFLFISCMITSAVTAQDAGRQKMLQEAASGLQAWLGNIPGGSESNYGFNSRTEFADATLGEPYEVFTLTGDFFREDIKQEKNYLKATGEWRIPVLVNQENRALITVVEKNDKWTIVSLGARELAHELQGFDSFPVFKNAKNLRLFRVFQLQSDFLFSGDPSSTSPEISFYPLHSASLNIAKVRESREKTFGLNQLLSFIKNSLK
jgi:hypothetical protein